MNRVGILAKRSPYNQQVASRVTFTVGVEAVNAINVALQVKTAGTRDVSRRVRLRAWLSSDANGDNILHGALMPTGGYAIGTDGTLFPGPQPANWLQAKATLIKDVTTAEQFSTSTTASFTINGKEYTKAAAVDLTFTAAHVVNANTFGVILVQVTAAGTISTKVPLATQLYASAALALAALPAPDAGNVALGYIAIANNAGTWTANTDDLTNASDVTTAAFVDAAESGALYPPTFDLLSEADGDIDITFSETLVRAPFYLNVQLPDGTVSTSGAITFT